MDESEIRERLIEYAKPRYQELAAMGSKYAHTSISSDGGSYAATTLMNATTAGKWELVDMVRAAQIALGLHIDTTKEIQKELSS